MYQPLKQKSPSYMNSVMFLAWHGFQHVNYFTFRDNHAHVAVCICAKADTISHTKTPMVSKLVCSLLLFWMGIYVPPVQKFPFPSMKSLSKEKPKGKRKKHHNSIFFIIQKASSPGLQSSTQLYNELFILGKQKMLYLRWQRAYKFASYICID